MSHKILFITILLLFSSCSRRKCIDEQLNELTSPVVVVAIGKKCNSCTPKVKVRDGEGLLKTISDESLESTQPGDTLR